MHPGQYKKRLAANGKVSPGRADLTDAANLPVPAHAKVKRGPPEPYIEPLLTDVHGAKAMLGLGATSIWALIGAGELRTVHFGKRTLIEVASIRELVARRLAETQSEKQDNGHRAANAREAL